MGLVAEKIMTGQKVSGTGGSGANKTSILMLVTIFIQGRRMIIPCSGPNTSSGDKESRSLLYPESLVLEDDSESRLHMDL